MSTSKEAEARIRRVLRDLDVALTAFDARADEIREASQQEATPSTAAMLAVALHHYYTAFESAIERAVLFLDGALPDGPDWHRALLREAARDLPDVRPAILSAPTLTDWEELRRFRHFFRHAYAVALDLERLRDHAELVHRLHPLARADLEALRTHLVDALTALDTGETSL